MSENDLILPSPHPSRRRIVGAVLLGLVMLAGAAAVIPLGVIMGLVFFNGCNGFQGPVRSLVGNFWLYFLWPVSVLAAALVPPVLLGLGRRGSIVFLVFVVCFLLSFCIGAAWLPVGSFANNCF